MKTIQSVEKIFSGAVWLMFFSFSVLIMLWVGFLFNITIPEAVVQVYMAVLGAFAVNRGIKEYKNGKG